MDLNNRVVCATCSLTPRPDQDNFYCSSCLFLAVDALHLTLKNEDEMEEDNPQLKVDSREADELRLLKSLHKQIEYVLGIFIFFLFCFKFS